MTIKVDWDNNEHTIVMFVFEGKWSLNEFYLTFEQVNKMMDSVDHPAHVILDMRKSGSLPNGFFGTIRSLAAKPHRNLGQMALVGGNGFVQGFINLSRKILPASTRQVRFMMTSTVEEARSRFVPVSEMTEPA